MDTLILNDKKFILVPEAECERLVAAAAAAAAHPSPVDATGTRPAVALADASIAMSIVRDREAAGLSQKELADLAGIRVEVLNRAERGAVVPRRADARKDRKCP